MTCTCKWFWLPGLLFVLGNGPCGGSDNPADGGLTDGGTADGKLMDSGSDAAVWDSSEPDLGPIADANVTFHRSTPTMKDATMFAVGDVDGDGFPDILTQRKEPEPSLTWTVQWFRNLRNGTFQLAGSTSQTIDYEYHPTACCVNDFNGDGNLDILAGNDVPDSRGQPSVVVFLGDGAGDFSSRIISEVGLSVTPPDVPYAVSTLLAGKFDNDEYADVLYDISPGYSDTIVMGTGSPSGRIFPGRFSVNAFIEAYPVAAMDFDGDGDDDVLLASIYKDNHSYHIGVALSRNWYSVDGYSTYGTAQCAWQRYGSWAADVNGDGRLDLLNAASCEDKLYVLYGNGNGDFDAAVSYRSLPKPSQILSGDFDGDGIDDVITTQIDTTDLSFFKGTPSGLLPATRVATGLPSAAYFAQTADLDRDGKTDLVIDDGSIVALLNTTP